METERIAMSQRERDRLRVLQEVQQKRLTQVEAARRLRVTDRHVRRLLIRIGERGDGGIVHQLRGRRIANWRRVGSRRFWLAFASARPTSGRRWLPNIWPRRACQ